MSENISRRDFFKAAAATTGAVALATAGASALNLSSLGGVQKAFAASDLADGTYKVNANLYITKNLVLIRKDAYFTNPTDPNDGEGIPETPVTGTNATMVVANGEYKITVPLVNECFMLLSAESGSTVAISPVATKTAKYTDTDGNSLTRITELECTVTSTGGTYELGDCREYAAYNNPPFPMSLLVPGYLDWPATLSVDFSSAVPA